MLVDSHAHLTSNFRSDAEATVARAKEAGVEKIITIGTTLADFREAIEIAARFPNVWATVGIHPEEDCYDWQLLETLAKQPRVVAIGECGLDYSRIRNLESSIQSKEKERQKNLFQKQIEIAQKLGLPMSIHTREAQEDLMTTDLSGARGVFHCFSGDENYLEFILKNLPGFYISFAGNVTFTNAKELQGLAKMVPLEKTLVETDSPFLAPHPLRGMQNEPANVKIVASKLAELHNTTLEKIAEITTKNAQELFKI